MSQRTRLVRVFFCLVTGAYLIGNIWKKIIMGCHMLAWFKELISSAASTSVQRVKNPVLGAFALSWCAFNWKQILYLLFSDEKIIVRINYISDVSNWWVSFLYPAASTAVICILLPLINLLIAWVQIKPLDLSDNIEHKKYMVKTTRRKERRKADAELDVIYEQTKTGAEKEIQSMKEEITASKDRMGVLTQDLEEANRKCQSLSEENKRLLDGLNLTEEERRRLSLNFIILDEFISDPLNRQNDFIKNISKLNSMMIKPGDDVDKKMREIQDFLRIIKPKDHNQ